jgi:hypothetical protein
MEDSMTGSTVITADVAKPDLGHVTGYRTVFFKELTDDRGHEWAVPLWSYVVPNATSENEAFEKAARQFEKEWPCASWAEVATHVEIEGTATHQMAEKLPPAKRLMWAEDAPKLLREPQLGN